MTDLAGARTELAAALAAVGVPVAPPGGADPPSALIFGDGIDLSDRGHVLRGQVPARFRVVVLGGIFDDATTPGGELMAALGDALAAIREADGWELQDCRADRVVSVAGSTYLAAEIIAARMIDL